MQGKFQDQLGNTVSLSLPPSRIVSLVPSQTELLADLGLNTEVVGITKFCIHPPEWRKTKTLIGGTKNFQIDRIAQLNPDLILANKEENVKDSVEELQRRFPVWISDIVSLNDSLAMIRSVGELTGKASSAESIAKAIENEFTGLSQPAFDFSVLYLIWRKPWMGAAPGTFIHAMMEASGLKNSLSSFERYPVLSANDIRSLSPDVIFLSSEPFPFKKQHGEELKIISPSSIIMKVDGEMFSWYGSRLLKAAVYIKNLKHELSAYFKTN